MHKILAAVLGLLTAVGGTVWAQQYVITTVAGGGLPPSGIQATSASFPAPYQVAMDGAGNTYFGAGSLVYKVDGAGTITRLAGGSQIGYSGDGGPAASALLNQNRGLVMDGSGNLFVADSGNNVIRKIAANGIITTVAGNGMAGSSGDGGPATAAQLNFPYGLAVDHSGNLYIADSGNHRIRKVSGGTITTVAGTGTPGYGGDGGPAASAQLNTPFGVAVDGSGNIYVADSYNNRVRVVAPGGTITTFAGNGAKGYSGDGAQATAAKLSTPYSVALDGSGNLYLADSGNQRVRMVAPGGMITTVAGNGGRGFAGDGGPATGTQLSSPRGVAADGAGNLRIADTNNNRIRSVTAGTIQTLAGNGQAAVGDGGPATGARLYFPSAAALAGNLYIADGADNVIREVGGNGIIWTVAGMGTPGYTGDGNAAGGARLSYPQGVAVDSAGDLFIADSNNNAIRMVAPNGIISTIAGNGTAGYSGDGGPASGARLNLPAGLALSSDALYIADEYNHAIRKMTGDGKINTVAGTGAAGYSGDSGQATSATLNFPGAVAVDASGVLFIADTGNNVIRKVALDGTITTFAGTGAAGYSGDAGLATSAQLNGPMGVAVDTGGNVYIADTNNNVIRKVTGDGVIATIAGEGTGAFSGDGGPARSAQLFSPGAVAVNAQGVVVVTNTNNNAIRLLFPQGGTPVLSVTLSHSGNFQQGQTVATYTATVSDAAGAGATSGTVTLTENAPAGLTLTTLSGDGWSCSANRCTRSDVLNPGSSYPPVTITVNVAMDAPAQVTNQVALTGGSAPPTTGSDSTNVLPMAPILILPANGATGVVTAPVLFWGAMPGATSYDVHFGTAATPPLVINTTDNWYVPGTLAASTTYYWQIATHNSAGATPSAVWSFTTGAAATGLRFVPVTPCRAVDTRGVSGTFGGPAMSGGTSRSFPIPQSTCGIPDSALAYSMNVTVVPQGPLPYLTLWPTGQTQPNVSTLNSFGGIVVANAAIVPAGSGGAVSVFVSGTTDVILDINGYFDTSSGPNSYAFYPATPCRIADTRGATGEFGGPSMYGGQTRAFPIPLGGCGFPATARGYSLNVTVVPQGYLGYLSAWPTGEGEPQVSTLNSWTGKVVANAAIVPAGTNESVSVYVSNPADVVLDGNGYFAAPGSTGALTFYAATPCRIADTRGGKGLFGGPEMGAGETRSFPIPVSACNIPATAVAYSLNVTAVPDGYLGYLSTWPAGAAQPVVSTLNSWDGSIVANAAIVPAGALDAISVYVSAPTHVILDINGYFAP